MAVRRGLRVRRGVHQRPAGSAHAGGGQHAAQRLLRRLAVPHGLARERPAPGGVVAAHQHPLPGVDREGVDTSPAAPAGAPRAPRTGGRRAPRTRASGRGGLPSTGSRTACIIAAATSRSSTSNRAPRPRTPVRPDLRTSSQNDAITRAPSSSHSASIRPEAREERASFSSSGAARTPSSRGPPHITRYGRREGGQRLASRVRLGSAAISELAAARSVLRDASG